MEKIDEYRNILAMPLCKLSIDKLVQEICLHPEYLKDIYQLISDDKIVVSWRAIWACEKVSEKHPGWFVPLLDDIIQRLLVCKHNGSKRLLLSILYTYIWSCLCRFAKLLPRSYVGATRKYWCAGVVYQNGLPALQVWAGTFERATTHIRECRYRILFHGR